MKDKSLTKRSTGTVTRNGWHLRMNASGMVCPRTGEPLYLPPYSSDLNPIERLWQVIKKEWFTDFIAKSQEQFIKRLDQALQWAMGRGEENQKTCKIAKSL